MRELIPNSTAKDTSAKDSSNDIRKVSNDAFIEKCMPELEALDKIRKVKRVVYEFRKKLSYPVIAICTPFLVYLDYLLIIWQRGNDDSGAGISIAFLGAIYWWVTQPKRQYAKAYKKEILPDIAKFFGNFTYDIAGKIDMNSMESSKIIPAHTAYKSEDYFRGAYKGVDIEFSEINLTKTSGSGKNKRTVTVFKGLVILLEMEGKKFYGHTILDYNKTKMGEWFKSKSLDLKRARMADPEFEKLFDAYTNDQVEARYLIDPLIIEEYKKLYSYYAEAQKRDQRPPDQSWIEKLKNARHSLQSLPTSKAKSLTVAYYDSKLLIMIGSPFNHFEPADLHIPATDPTSILHMKQEIGDILSIIDKMDAYDPRAIHEENAKAKPQQGALESDSNL